MNDLSSAPIDRTTSARALHRGIDPRGPRFNQAVVSVGLLGAYLADVRWLVGMMALALGLGAVFGAAYGPFLRFYALVIRPRLAAPSELEDPRPPRFAASLGTLFLLASVVSFLVGAPTLGWALTLLVAALAGLAALTNICVGCELYLAARRFGHRPGTVAAG